MCHEIAESQLGGPSMERLRNSSEAGEIWIFTDAIPAMSASIFWEQDFLDHRECIAASQQLMRVTWLALNLVHPLKISGYTAYPLFQLMEIVFMTTHMHKNVSCWSLLW